MSSYQGGRGGRDRGGAYGGQYDNQGRGSGTNPNWRGSPPQHSGAGSPSVGDTGGNPRAQYFQPRGPQGGNFGSTSTSRGSSCQQMYPLQGSGVRHQYRDLNPRPPQQPKWVQRVRAPLAQYPASTQQQQARGPYPHQASQPKQLAAIPQATPMAAGGVSTHKSADEELEELMSELAVQSATPSPTGNAKAIKFLCRPGKGTRSQKVVVGANHFLVQLSCKELHHYDVIITPTVTSRGTNREVMKALVNAYQQTSLAGQHPVYDGRRSLYTAGPLPFETQRFVVTLSDEDRPRRKRVFKVEIEHVGSANLSHLEMFLMGEQHDAPHDIIQALDIVLGELPSNRSYKLEDGLISWQGFYKSLCPTQMGLSLNLDISSTAFIDSVLVSEFVSKLVGKDLNNARLTNADIGKIKKNLKGLKIEVTHCSNLRRKYRISGLTTLATRDLVFPCDELGTKKKLVDYSREVYDQNIRYLNIPCLEAGTNPKRPIYLPMEVCRIVKGQKYRKKLNENQTTNLLRATCQKPVDRENIILNTIRDNNYSKDIFAMEFGLKVGEQPTIIEAHVLPPPLLKYHDKGSEKECTPRFGSWNMKGKIQWFAHG